MTWAPSRLRGADLIGLGVAGMRSRPLRAVLSALGIAVGVAAMTVIVSISASSRAEVDAQLEALGTNLLTVSPGESLTGEEVSLPSESIDMVARIGPVEAVGAIGTVDAKVYRNEAIDPAESNGIAVYAATTDLLGTVGGEVAEGRFLDEALAPYPTAVLGATTAERLGIGVADGSVAVWIGDRYFAVVGLLEPVPLAPELDAAALVGWQVAEDGLGFDGAPTTVYERSPDSTVEAVRNVLAATANPAAPQETLVSRPSDALAAKAATDRTLTTLLLSLGSVALLVGGIGVANTMVIAVLERRGEVGLRRSLGATRAHIRRQFLVESMLLSGMGGLAGAVLGGVASGGFAVWRGWPVAIPPWALVAAVALTVAVGAIAGAYPASKAARYSPTVALGSY